MNKITEVKTMNRDNKVLNDTELETVNGGISWQFFEGIESSCELRPLKPEIKFADENSFFD